MSVRSFVGTKMRDSSGASNTQSGYRMEDAHSLRAEGGETRLCIADGHGSVLLEDGSFVGGFDMASFCAKAGVVASWEGRQSGFYASLQSLSEKKMRDMISSRGIGVGVTPSGHHILRGKDGEETSHSGCTLTRLVFRGKEVLCDNVGDSEAHLFPARGERKELTTNHDVSNKEEVERMRRAACQRKGKAYFEVKDEGVPSYLLQVTRSMGHFGSPSVLQAPSLSRSEWEEGDIVVAASDGLWRYVPARKVGEILFSFPHLDAATLSDKIGAAAFLHPKDRKDNATIAVVKHCGTKK